MTPPRVVHVVDDDAAVRAALGSLLAVCGFAVRAHEHGDALLAALPGLAPGCILLDLRMPGRSGLEVQAELERLGVPHPVVFLSAHGDLPTGIAAMKQGAVDFLEKPVREQPLLDALARAFARLDATVTRQASSRAARARLEALTPREREVVALVVAGRRNREIAVRLRIALPTVKVHRRRGMAKLGATTMPELVRAWQAATSEP
jgi:FixJ family two-component response regulator